MRLFLAAAVALVVCLGSLFGETTASAVKKESAPVPPLFTGPLLTPSGHVVPRGFVNFEPYAFVNVTTGKYDDDWNSSSVPNFVNVNWQGPIFIGLTPMSDILLVPQASWNSTMGVSNLVFNDFIVEYDLALVQDTRTNKIPGVKIYIQETFPTGQYERLDPQKLGTDAGGRGTFATNVGFVITRVFHMYDDHFLALRLNPFYTFRTKVDVKGVNAYGGAKDTDARVDPGDSYGAFFGAEYNLSRHWALALDVAGSYEYKTTFKGNPGTLSSLASPEAIQFSLAPAIEYNFNASVGIIAGAWFTVAGKNSSRFASGAIAINYFGPIPTGTKYQYIQTGGGGI
ncbi:MAG: hypothetical protein K940chlam2_00145 [Chlamydiae bacterium]|nr:hypothetical protein [Chlamydiota bacterium]